MEGGQVMVVCIVALVMLTSLIKASIQSKNNANKKICGRQTKTLLKQTNCFSK